MELSSLLCNLYLDRNNNGGAGEGFGAVLALERDTLHDRSFIHELAEIELTRSDFLALFGI